jgi:hypothetical protein
VSDQQAAAIWGGWDGFRAGVVPADASPVQVREMRRAFYAGAWVALNAVKIVCDEHGGDEAAALAEMRKLFDECVQFAKSVREGRDV